MKPRYALAALFVSLLLAFGIAAAPTPAHAQPFCYSGYICLYRDQQGTSLIRSKPASDWVFNYCYDMGSLDNSIGYVVNNSPYTIVVYLGYGCSGTYGDWWAYSAGPMTGEWYHNISSSFRPS